MTQTRQSNSAAAEDLNNETFAAGLAERLINECILLAQTAMRLGEVPIAAVVARGSGEIVGWGFNELNAKRDPTMHAEIAAFRDAAGRFPTGAQDLILASTLEPCVMCAGAAYLCGVSTIVYGLRAPADSGMSRISPPTSPAAHRPNVVGPIRANQIRQLFEEWLAQPARNQDQVEYVRQLLALQT